MSNEGAEPRESTHLVQVGGAQLRLFPRGRVPVVMTGRPGRGGGQRQEHVKFSHVRRILLFFVAFAS